MWILKSEGSYVKLMRKCKSKTQCNSPMTSPDETNEVYLHHGQGCGRKSLKYSHCQRNCQAAHLPFKCIVTLIISMEDLNITKTEANNMQYLKLLEAHITEVNDWRSTQLKSAKVGPYVFD